MTRRSPAVALSSIAAAALVSCGNSVPPPVPIGASPTPFSFNGTLTLSGEIRLQGRFADAITLRNETCQQYVRALAPATTLWVVPTPNDSESVDGHVVSYTAGVPSERPSTGYHGPGTYVSPSAIVSVLVVDNASFAVSDGARTMISVNSDGSGSMTFTGLADTATNALEAGSVRWSCTD